MKLLQALLRLPQWTLITLVQGYRLFFRAWIGPVCRYEPSCSTYALQALREHGAMRGGRLAAWRVLRCNPWCLGGHDPVPRRAQGLFTSLIALPCDPSGPPESGDNAKTLPRTSS